ncbi:MAG: DUF3750 domain-containing protein [Rhodospirillales bacterium]|nr:DUF3750 domain-containing protein [Rhodospirillales bacterium]MSP79523.1 DUF3750 domain-containing protein [Rhodospirillales bacterium]
MATIGTWIVAVGLIAVAVVAVSRTVGADWRTANRESAGIAPDPGIVREAVAQVYAARAYGWRGAFGVHTWIAVKPTDADSFTVYQLIGWRVARGGEGLVIDKRPADQRWFGATPELLVDLRGPGVDAVIAKIDTAARGYPHNGDYGLWPGPNSNTFVAHVAREVPELRLDLPPTAIGKDYLPNGGVLASAPSGTGMQVSLFGLLGVLAGVEEGVEVNILGLVFGIDPLDFALKLPIVGRLAPSPPVDRPRGLVGGAVPPLGGQNTESPAAPGLSDWRPAPPRAGEGS